MSHDDDRSIGHLLTRREILASLGIAAAVTTLPVGALFAASRRRLPRCIVRPAQTEGPYFVDTGLDRSDIRSDPASGMVPQGEPFTLTFQVGRMDGSSCTPMAGVLVDIWQCDAQGIYSGVKDINNLFDTTGRQFLRGHQRTDANGQAMFQTIFPGWYQGRTVHIHFKLRTDPAAGRGHEFTSQLYFEDKVGDELFTHAPYAANKQARVRNSGDGIFRRERGFELVMDVVRESKGFRGVFDVGMILG
jgi:protocatechuate 3,4-dioxygenase beta subunit